MCKATYEGSSTHGQGGGSTAGPTPGTSSAQLSGASKAGLAATGAFALATAAAALGLSQWIAAPQKAGLGHNKLML